ncbi:MAG: metallophosphoesterase family protein, partial [bacterium]
AELTMDDRKIAVVHYDNIAHAVTASGQFDVVCYGHNHKYEVVRQGKTLKINPGELMGGLSGISTFVVYDTEIDEVTRFEI